jgi:type I restriction enzyme R subunit
MKDDISEAKTREEFIDKELKKRGWLKKYIKDEVNSVKSDFKNKNYVLAGGSIEKDVDRFIDYLLLNEDYSPLAIIEAKKFSRNPEKGRIQARTYVKDIEKQIGEIIPIFLTNGHKWIHIDSHGVERNVSGPFSQEDLKRRRQLYLNEKNPVKVNINNKIVDRERSVITVSKLAEHFNQGHRKALIHMATGTGKTRVSMAIIDLLINSNYVRNVLFVVDRISLANQAKEDGFKKFFNEPVGDLRADSKDKSSRLYVTTVQTLMGSTGKELYKKFSPAFFDLIIFDEAHRSYYDKQNVIFKYFDTIQIGLTATPRNHESKNTFDLFECDNGKPTVEYSYDEAVRDKTLVPYSTYSVDTQVLSLGIKGAELTKDLRDQLFKQEENPNVVEFRGSQFDRVFMDDKTNEIIIREFMNSCYKSDEGMPCKSIFFCASQRHANSIKRIFGKLFPRMGSEVQVITSDEYRAQDEIKRFKNNSEPRIALSVGMLDTGVDIPEVMNLVFVKPVLSHMRFWQMLGRGTRNLQACKHREWLPNNDKKDFLIFDFKIGGHSNIEYHELDKGTERASGEDVITKIFRNRIELLEKEMDEKQKKLIQEKINEEINKLDEDSFIVREKLPLIRRLKSDKFNLDKYIAELKGEIASLMILNPRGNSNVSSFILRVEKLFKYLLENKSDQVAKTKEYVLEMLRNILEKDNLTEIKDNKTKIISVFQDSFWDDLTFDDVEFLIREIAPLMKYYERIGKRIVQIDAPDLILSIEKSAKELKEDTNLMHFLETNPFIKKIKSGEGITSDELLKIEKKFSELRPGLTIENVQRLQKIDFLLFLRKIMGLTKEYDPKVLIEQEFNNKIIQSGNNYNSKQLEFLNLL